MTFKELLSASGMSVAEYARHFNIPFRTVLKWAREERTPPPYVVELMRFKLEKEKEEGV